MTVAETPDNALRAALLESSHRFAQANPLSHKAHLKAGRFFPGGHTRQTLLHSPFPLTIAAAEWARLTDIDGHDYVDLQGNYTASLYGHTSEPLQRAITDAMQGGISVGGLNTDEIELADLITSRIPSIENVRFCHSGSEACLFTVLLARHVTKRPALLVFKGAYHGGFMIYGDVDPPLNVPFQTIKAVYNDVEGTRSAFREHAASLAAVIVEPMIGSGGCIPAKVEFLAMLREETAARGIVLIFDEVMTSRLGPRGAQGLYGIEPDLTTLGKYWGGGFGFGAFGGKRTLMKHFDTSGGGLLSQAGTFNNNSMTMSAGVAGIRHHFTPEACVDLNARGDALREKLGRLAQSHGVALQATGIGSVMNTHWHARPITSPRDVESPTSELRRLFHLEMLQQGFYLAPRGLIALSLPLTKTDLDGFIGAVETFLSTHKSILPKNQPTA